MRWRCEYDPEETGIAHQNLIGSFTAYLGTSVWTEGRSIASILISASPGFASMALRSASYSLLIPSLAHQR